MAVNWRKRVHSLGLYMVAHVLPKWAVQAVMYAMQAKFVVAVVVVLRRGESVLLLSHSYRPRYPWGLLTGWVDAGETPEEAARRETREETGLEISQLHYFYSGTVHPHHMEIGFWAEVKGPLESAASGDGEISGTRWFLADALPADLLPAQRPLIDEALTRSLREFS